MSSVSLLKNNPHENWDYFYEKFVPNFYHYNQKISWISPLVLSAIPASMIFATSSETVKIACIVAAVIPPACKCALYGGEIFQRAVNKKTRFGEEYRAWGNLKFLPTDFRATQWRVRMKELEEKYNDKNFEGDEQEKVCDEIIDLGSKVLEVADQDLQKWVKEEKLWWPHLSEDKQWGIKETPAKPFSPADYLCCQNAYLYAALFGFAGLYQKIFHYYPQTDSRSKEWKAFFFQEGTKQFSWRQKYNSSLDKIFESAGGRESVKQRDSRWTSCAEPHLTLEQKFAEGPRSRPTG